MTRLIKHVGDMTLVLREPTVIIWPNKRHGHSCDWNQNVKLFGQCT